MCNNTTKCNNYPVATAYLTIPTAMDVERCPTCRRSIATCRCEAPVQPRRAEIVDSADAQSMGWDTCPTCRQNISDCSCAVKNQFAIDCAAKHIAFMVDSAMKNDLLTLGPFPGQSTLSDNCPICRQNISDCCCAVKNKFAISTLSDTCPICRQNISDCCCAVNNQFAIDCAAKHIAFMVDSAVKNGLLITEDSGVC
ncbi:hypothetical protein CBER1_08338 [Cercospora berteroae]|uniref:Uncharacterized protein n=1 Tax=Cercospora berteroae TaxID=357750 RepID=A0A2S6CFG1_9PEZI|nr:hypothetical protein CBER1_08338 [Cercospora berteroae]